MKPGRELDALVAKQVIGWKRIYESGPNGEPGCLDEHQIERNDDEIPHYSTSIEAAWQVVEKMEFSMPDTWTFSLFGGRRDWHVEIDSNDGKFLQNAASVNVFTRAETPAHAICLAALKAVGYEAPA
jgi:hypothetical protein